MSLQQAAYLAQVLAAVSAIVLARRHAAHGPAAVALVLLAASSLLHAPTAAALTPYPVEPWHGWHRVLVYLDGALSLASSAIIAGLALAVTVAPERRRRATAIFVGVWLLASVVLAALYPSPLVRGVGLQRVYFATDLIGLCVATIALVTWARAGIAAKRSPDSASMVALALVIFDAGVLLAPFSPWRADLFSAPYFGPQFVLMVLFAVISAAQVLLWKFSQPRG